MMNILKKPRYFNLVLQGLLLVTIFQQVYFPQHYKYLHLAVIIVRMLISEMYEQDYRFHPLDRWFVPTLLMTAVVSIVEKTAGFSLGFLYLILLMASLIMVIVMINGVITDSKTESHEYKMHPKHINMLKKGKGMTLGILYGMNLLVMIGFIYSFYELIKLILS